MMSGERSSYLSTAVNYLKTIQHDSYILAGMLILSVAGVAVTDAFEDMSHWYWLAMVPVFFGASLFVDWKKHVDNPPKLRVLLLNHLKHWIGLIVAVYIAFMLRRIGSLDNQTTGLMLLSNFALATYLAGDISGWLFRLIGIFLAFSLVIVAYMEHYIWVVIIASLVLLAVYQIIIHRYQKLTV